MLQQNDDKLINPETNILLQNLFPAYQGDHLQRDQITLFSIHTQKEDIKGLQAPPKLKENRGTCKLTPQGGDQIIHTVGNYRKNNPIFQK